jgi:hypothetical protein
LRFLSTLESVLVFRHFFTRISCVLARLLRHPCRPHMMGSRHNRRRVRSRPRHRRTNRYNPSISSLSTIPSESIPSIKPRFSYTAIPICGPSGFSNPLWPVINQTWQPPLTATFSQWSGQDTFWATEQQRIYGGEPGDGDALCAPMLQVVLDLFDGVDYVDP